MKRRWTVPDELMIALGSRATAEFNRCADTWTDSEIASIRARLPQQYHAVPIDELRMQFQAIRKRGTPGFRVNGHGPAKGSRKYAHVSERYREYLLSVDWQQRRKRWLEFWESSCCVCNSTSHVDVHHRTYERLGHESLNDCVVLCRQCHDLFHHDQGERNNLTLFASLAE